MDWECFELAGLKIHFYFFFTNMKHKKSPWAQGALVIFFFFFALFFWLHWVFVAMHGLSLVAASGSYSSLWCSGFSLQGLLLVQNRGSMCIGFSGCSTQAQQLHI